MATNSDARHECRVCGRVFSSRNGLASHFGQMHEGSPFVEDTEVAAMYDDGASIYEICNELDASFGVVQRALDRAGVDTGMPDAASEQPWDDVDRVVRLYKEYNSSNKVADILGCAGSTIRRVLHNAEENVSLFTPPKLFTTTSGYERMSSQSDGENHVVQHHRLLAVSEWGFDAVVGKVVHHKNNIPWDNRPRNLQLMTNSEHARHHALHDDPREDDGREVSGSGGGD